MIMKRIFTLITLCMAAIGMQAQDTWTVAGSTAIFGSEWNINDEANNMTKNNDGLWVLKKEGCVLEAGAENKFKVVKNHSWAEAYPSSDYIYKVTETGTYTVTITFDETTHEVTCNGTKTGEAVIGEKTWTVAGETALTGYDWKPENSENDMEKQSDGTYKKVFTNVILSAKTYKFKVCANHSWSEAYPGNDYELVIETAGTYDVTITFNPDTKAVNAIADKKSDEVGEKTWTVAGDEALTGFNWKPENSENDMEKQSDGTYKKVFENVSLTAGTEYKLKVCANHAWGEDYGKDGGDYIFTVEQDGIYNITVVFDPATTIVTVSVELVTATGIATVNRESFTVNQYYDLQGRRVAQPRHGIVIENRKKVIK